jgi:hypothetical protein
VARPLGVGIVGAGLAAQAIHLPAITALPERLQVTHVMDVDGRLAEAVARRFRANATTDLDALLSDSSVDVVAICSPNRFHAAQVLASCAAGKRAVLCEKPLVTTHADAQLVDAASASSGVPILVGTMHAYDLAVSASRQVWENLPQTWYLIRSVIYIPPDSEFAGLSTDLVRASLPETTADASESPHNQPADLVRNGILGLASHDLPIVRALAPSVGAVSLAHPMRPSGYHVTHHTAERTVQLIAISGGAWAPRWEIQAWGEGQEMRISFPPSYVMGRSARVTITTNSSCRSWQSATSSYIAQWSHLADVAEGRSTPRFSIDEIIADITYALDLADAAADSIGMLARGIE